MDIVELKGVNRKMLAGSASSVTNTAADRSNVVTVAEDEKKARRKYNQAYCEFDIVAAYNARKKQKSCRSKHGKDRPKEQRSRDHSKERSKSKKSEKKSELSKKIEDLTARNEKIKQLIENNAHEGDSRQDGASRSKSKDTERSRTISESRHERRRHREHKTRRSTRCCPGHEKISIISEKSKQSKEIDKSDIHDVSAKHKHCSQKEHSEKNNGLERKTEFNKQSSFIPKITVRLRNNSDKHSSKSPDGHKSEKPERKVPESKSQLIKLTNYEQKSRSSDRQHKVSSKDDRSKDIVKESRNDIITVYENSNIMEETDSIMSKDTLRRSKTYTRAASFARESSNIRHYPRASSMARESSNVRRNPILENPAPKAKSQEDEKRVITKKPDVQLQVIIKNDDSNESRVQALCTCEESVGSPTVEYRTETRKGNDESPTRSSLSPRKELSFSNLNLQPNIYHYASPPRMATTQTSVSRIETPGFGSLGVGVHSSYFPPEVPKVENPPYKFSSYNKPGTGTPELLSQTAIAMRDIMQVRELEQMYQPKHQTKSIKSKFMENTSFVSDVSKRLPTSMKSCLSKNSRFHKTRCDAAGRIVEIASKTCNDQQVAFTVEGVEPPRRLKGSQDSNKPLKIENVYNIQVFPGITINQSDLKESDLQLLSHGPEKPKQYVQESAAALNQCNESQGTFVGSGSVFPFMRGLGNTNSEFKPKESTDVSYKFKKRYWSNKELPKKKSKDKKKKKTKATKADMAVQTGLDELEEEEVLERDIGVSTADCNLLPQKVSKDMQVQVTFPELPSFAKSSPRKHNKHFKIIERSSRSDSNVSFSKERFLMQTDYTAYPEQTVMTRPQTSDKRKEKGISKSTSKQKIITSSCEECDKHTTRICRESPVSSPRKCRPTQKHRKQRQQQQQQVQRSSQHAVHPVMSTGSIREVPRPRKTRSKSLTYDRDSLVEKINFNKQTIKHHHQEIVALEKCLNDILCRLKEDDSVSKVAIVGDSTDTKSDNKLLDSRNNDSCVSSDTYNVSNDSRMLKDDKKAKGGKEDQRNCRRTKSRTGKTKSRTKLSTSKFQRRKIYGEILKRRYRRAKEKNTDLRKCEDENVSPVRVKSVYKNYKGFVSSATSISSKISEAYSSSTYPQSIPSLNFCLSMNKPEQHEGRSTPHRHSPRTHQTAIVKKKSKLYPNEVKHSKKKSKSIYDLLLRYINLAKEEDSDSELVKEESRIVVLSVSSLKLKKPSSILCYANPRPRKDNSKGSRKVKVVSASEEHSDCDNNTSHKKPFYIGKRPKQHALPKAVPKLALTSEDSLENESKSRTPNLCPLTAIFNFEPPKQNYFVYNAEIFSTNKPKVDIVKTQRSPRTPSSINLGSGRSSVASTSRSPDNSKLKTITEENPVDSSKSSRKKSPKRLPSAEGLVRSVGVADLSPVLSRRKDGYPSYDDVMKSLEKIDLGKEEKPKLTTFNCNDSECSNLIFNYTSKKDARDIAEKPSSKERSPKPSSSAYHTMTTIMDSKPGSFQSPSESDTAIRNESGYESSKKSSTFKNFFKKKTLMDVFKTKTKRKSLESSPSIPENIAVADNRLPACIISKESLRKSDRLDASSEESVGQQLDGSQEQNRSPFIDNKTVMWFNFRKKKRDAGLGCDPWCVNRTSRSDQTEVPAICAKTCHKTTKCMSTNTWKGLLKTECPCVQPFEKQREQCKKYASKVLMEAAQRQKGYEKQYKDFEEMSLKVLMGDKSCTCEKLRQGCPKSYANKAAGIQVKFPSKSEDVQVKPRSVSIHEPSTVSIDGLPVSGGNSPRPSSPGRLPSPPPSNRASSVHGEELDDEMPEKLEDEKGGSVVEPSPSVSEAAAAPASADDEVSSFRSYTDKEIFDRLLRNYERKDAIADRLSSDEVFHQDQIDAVKSGMTPDLHIQQDRDRSVEERARGPRFSDRPKPMIHVTTDTTVRPDDIGTCFARGFRPDNLMLSGDACFHINKQDKIKMSPYMLKNTESIIDFSERETPLDFLLALGFMVDEASNALKDDDIRSRLLAAITEARVWINKITTTQGTLLYLVAYKARPETMRYFLQLVEAIINKRINNAIRLDGFLRVLEDVEAGRVQMINILGEDKFEDEENEEKIIKKQLKSLFISVYTIAEKEASVSGRTLTANQVSLLRILVAKYRAGLHPHLELIARYIGQGLLENDIQLEAAMIFLSRLDTSEVKLKEFENYCGITCQLQDT